MKEPQEEKEVNTLPSNDKLRAIATAFALDVPQLMETKLMFGIRYSKTIDRAIPDPSQPEIEFGGPKVAGKRLRGGGK